MVCLVNDPLCGRGSTRITGSLARQSGLARSERKDHTICSGADMCDAERSVPVSLGIDDVAATADKQLLQVGEAHNDCCRYADARRK